MKSSLSSVYALLLVIGDFIAIMGAFTAAFILRVTLADGPFIAIGALEYARIFAYLSPLWIGVFALLNLYKREVYEWRFKEFGRLLVGSTLGIMAMITYEFGVNRPIFPARIITVYALGIGYLLLILNRTFVRILRLAARHRGYGIINTMIIGDSPYTSELINILDNPKKSGYQVVGIISNTKLPTSYKGAVFSSIEEGLAQIETLAVHSIVLTKFYQDSTINEKIVAAAQANHCGFRFVATEQGVFGGSMEVELFQDTPLVLVHQTPLIGVNRIYKRLFDIIMSVLLLIVTLPISLIIYVILLATGGSPIYTRKRLTRFGRDFNIYKFRSLKIEYNGLDPEQGFEKMGRPELAKQFRANGDQLENDPRISSFGRLIRALSLDELPQLYNVLRGDISLVGPRALIAEELNTYAKRDLILSAKSGLTGLAVISGRKNISFEERRQLDVYYIQNWSFWLDIKIILRTIVEVLSRRGAA